MASGAALGLLSFKPQLALAVTVVAIGARQSRLIIGATLSLALQAAITLWLLGPSVFGDYLSYLREFPSLVDTFQRDASKTHSLRTLFSLFLPGKLALGAYLVACGIVLHRTTRVFRVTKDLQLAGSLLIIASVLVSPHLLSMTLH